MDVPSEVLEMPYAGQSEVIAHDDVCARRQNNVDVAKEEQVASKDCLTIQEPKLNDTTDQQTRTVKKFAKCNFKDNPNKCTKHQLYFCEQQTQCYICKKAVSRGSLSSHYVTVHQEITHTNGSTWRVETSNEYRWCLMSDVHGKAVVCQYRLYNSQFSLWVYTELLSEQLREYRCKVRVSNTRVHNFKPEARKTVMHDWLIKRNMKKLCDITQLNVSVDIRKKHSF